LATSFECPVLKEIGREGIVTGPDQEMYSQRRACRACKGNYGRRWKDRNNDFGTG